MHAFIDFPNLGIHLENVGKTVTVFGFDIAYYGITMLSACWRESWWQPRWQKDRAEAGGLY